MSLGSRLLVIKKHVKKHGKKKHGKREAREGQKHREARDTQLSEKKKHGD
jgi:hypothetical protein